jgi:uncharacterized membrane protein YfcA
MTGDGRRAPPNAARVVVPLASSILGVVVGHHISRGAVPAVIGGLLLLGVIEFAWRRRTARRGPDSSDHN